MENKNGLLKVFKNNFYLFKLCYKSDLKYIVFHIIDVVRNVVNYFLEYVFGLKFILECVEFHKPIRYTFYYLIFLFIFVSLGMVYSAWFNENYKLVKLPALKSKVKEILYEKAKSVDIECYDNPEYYNDFVFSVAQLDEQCDRVIELISKIATCISALILMGGFFIVNDAMSLLYIVFIFVLSTFINKGLSKFNFIIKLKKNYNERKKEYVKRTFYLNDYAKEMRLNSKLSTILLTSFGEINDELIDIEKKNAKKRTVLAFLQYFICEFFLQNFVYIIYLLYKALILKVMSLSNVIVLFKSSTQVKESIDELAKIYPYACETSMYIDKLKIFINTEVKIKSEGDLIPNKDAQTLELKHIYYSYNDRDYVLKDINMKIDLPSKIAIVGTNGAGKTTLVRLIMRMSDVSSGEILLDGINIKEYNLEEYRKFIGVVFQNFNLYAASLLENVVLDTTTKGTEENVLDALKKCEFEERFNKLEHGLDTEITTEFYEDGTNLSGGEAQKVAIARAVYGDCPMIILDEPSSALDPIAEYKLNKIMMDFGYRKQIFFISHRLSTTRDADFIYVLKDGQLIEHGTHKDLLDHAGLYNTMWNAQSSHYQ